MSSLLFRVVFAQECTSTHHKLAMDALQQLRDEQAPAWRDMLLYYFDAYLDGSKAPDKKFKDFRNHVLHVGENFWGGAVERCNHWYGETVQLLREKKWREAAYAAGVLSHYFTDPLMPFHTGQSEEETQIHRAVEWSITKSYDRLRAILVNELGGFPVVDTPRGDDWLAQMVKQGARKAHAHYQMMIDHYDFAIGVADPPAALDQEIKDAVAELLGHAAVGFARVLDRAFADAAVQPPAKRLTLGGYLSLLTIPIAWVERKLADGRDRAIVKAMYGEFKKSGRVRESLPEDDRAVRQAHADEVLKRPLDEIEAAELRPIGSKHGTGKPSRDPVAKTPRKVRPTKPVREKVDKKKAAAERATTNKVSETKPTAASTKSDKPNRENVAPAREIQQPAAASPTLRMHSAGEKPTASAGSDRRFYLEPSSDIVDAPSIGNKTARRFQAIGIRTVADFLKGNPEQMAARLKTGWLTADTLRDWQDQATLVCRIPGLRGHDAQLLVGCGLRSPGDIATAEAANLYQKVLAFCETSAGQRVLREASIPELDEVKLWIRSAREARPSQAA